MAFNGKDTIPINAGLSKVIEKLNCFSSMWIAWIRVTYLHIQSSIDSVVQYSTEYTIHPKIQRVFLSA